MTDFTFFFLNRDEEVVGILTSAEKCIVHERDYTAEFEFEKSDAFSFDDCAYVGFDDIDGNLVFYELLKMNKSSGKPGIYSFKGENAAMSELLEEIVEGRAVEGAEAGFAVSRVIENTRWSMESADSTPQMSTLFWYKNVWECLETIKEKTGCALYFSWTIAGSVVSARRIIVKARLGESRGKRFDMSKDLTGIEVTEDRSAVYTLLYGRGKGEEVGKTESGDATYGRRIDFADVVWSVANGDPIDKPLGQAYIEDPIATQHLGRGAIGEKRPRKNVVIFSDVEDPDELLRLTWEKLKSTRYPKLTISAKVVDLERVFGYTHEAIRLGDDVLVIADEWDAVYLDAVVDISRDYLNPLNTAVTIGEESSTTYSITSGLSAKIESIKEKAEIGSDLATKNPDLIKGVINTMVTQIISSGTGITTDPDDGSLILTASDGSSAVKLTGSGILISDSKIGGAWVWKTALSGDGIVTSLLTTGVLQASLIKILGTEQFYWDSSNIFILNPEDTDQQIRIGKYDGENYGIAFTQDGGATWQNAIGFDGVHFSAGDTTGIHIGTEAPANPKEDEVWLDTSGVPNTFYRWDLTSWVDCGQEVDVSSELSQLQSDMQTYVTNNAASKSDFNGFQKTVGSILDIDPNGKTTLIQRIYEAIDASGDAAAEQYKEILKYVYVDNGIIYLGNSENEFTLEIHNDRIRFMQGSSQIALLSNRIMEIGNAFIQKGGMLQLGDFGFVPEQDGSLSFLKIGGD